MSYNWAFYSFDYAQFERALIHSRRKAVDSVIDEMRQFHEKPDIINRHIAVGRRLSERGFSYEGVPARDLKIVDRFVFNFFCALSQDIGGEPESPEFLSPNVTSQFPSHLEKRSFWSRPAPVPAERAAYFYLPFFTHNGRRLGQQVPSSCEYVAFDARETQLLKSEIEKFLASPDGRELNADNFNTIQNDFLGPVESTLKKGKSLHARLS